MIRYAVVAAVLLVAGCSTDPVRMMHSRTGAVATCGPYPSMGIRSISAVEHEAQCIRDFQRQGYERAP